jgi:rabenosyn-5
VEEANAQRKFEDAKTLKVNLKEIRGEIERLLNGREGVAGIGPETGNTHV